jgi:hypothetical protein
MRRGSDRAAATTTGNDELHRDGYGCWDGQDGYGDSRRDSVVELRTKNVD